MQKEIGQEVKMLNETAFQLVRMASLMMDIADDIEREMACQTCDEYIGFYIKAKMRIYSDEMKCRFSDVLKSDMLRCLTDNSTK